jgi:uncharacterized protein
MQNISLTKLAVLLLAGPVLFLLAIVLVSVGLAVMGTPPDQIGAAVPRYVPHILLAVLLALAALLTGLVPVRQVWVRPHPGRTLTDTALGAAVGAVLAGVYLTLLAPLLESLQRNPGDYVPPGAVLTTLSSQIGLFFVANVLLAPVVEETLYRGVALQGLTLRFGRMTAVLISCAAFGTLHWTGGLWYMLLTGIIAGGSFSALAVLRGGLIAPFAAHLTLNLIEFAYTAAL